MIKLLRRSSRGVEKTAQISQLHAQNQILTADIETFET